MKRGVRLPLLVVSLLAVVGLAFVTTRTLLPMVVIEGDVTAPSSVSGTTAPAKIDQTQRTAIAKRDEPFAGELNGFTFFDMATQGDLNYTRICGTAPAFPIDAAAAEASIWFAFRAAYVPTTLGAPRIESVGCMQNGKVEPLHYTLIFNDAKVSRVPGTFAFPSGIAKDDLKPGTIAGKSALIAADEPKNRTTIFMRDGETSWEVSCGSVSTSECVKLAEGVEPTGD